VPRLVLHVLPESLPAKVVLDGRPLDPDHISDPRRLNPGVHAVEASAPGRRTSSVVITLHERDSMSLDIPLALETAPAEVSATSPTPAPQDGAASVAPSPWPPTRVGAVVATVVAVGLAGGGVGAYVAAGAAHDDGVQSCGAMIDRAGGACDGQRNTVRAWDWTAAGAWAGAAVSAGIAVFLWTRPTRPAHAAASISWSIGPGSCAIGGSF
jgi:hypothetical protein